MNRERVKRSESKKKKERVQRLKREVVRNNVCQKKSRGRMTTGHLNSNNKKNYIVKLLKEELFNFFILKNISPSCNWISNTSLVLL